MTSAGGIAKLELLRDAAVGALSQVAGVEAILGFGSLATGTADAWSDVDLEVIVSDVGGVAPQVFGSLAEVGELSFVYPLTDDHPPDGVIAFFGDYGYFNKLDVAVATEPKFAREGSTELFRRTQSSPDRLAVVAGTPPFVLHDRPFSDAVLTGLRAIKYMKRDQWLPANHLFRSLTGSVIDRFAALVLDDPTRARVAQLLQLSRADFDQKGRLLAVAQCAPSEAAVLELLRLLRHAGSSAPGPGDAERNFLRRALTFLERYS